MHGSPDRSSVLRALAGVGLALFPAATAWAQSTSLVSMDASGQLTNDDAYDAVISDDGRYVGFQWYDSFTLADVFLADRATGAIERISVSSGEVRGDSYSYAPTLTPGLRYVAFSSLSTNLVPGDTNGPYPLGHDVFLRDRLAGTTERVSIGSSGQQGNDQSFHPAISADGRFVAFTSFAGNLVAVDANGVSDVFVRDRAGATTELASLASNGAQGDGAMTCASISADGRYVVFWGEASNLVGGDTNGSADVFVRDRLNAATERVSVDSSGAQANAGSTGGMISPDGRFVAFRSSATNLVTGDTNGKADIFLRDRQTGSTERLSVDSTGTQADGDSSHPALTPDGRYVAFQSKATNLVAGDTNGRWDIFVRDRLAGTTERASLDSNGGEGDLDSGIQGPTLSADGRWVAFDSRAQLVGADSDAWHDIYVRDRTGETLSYCTVKQNSLGCWPAMGATGTSSASATSGFTLTASPLLDQSIGLLLYGLDGQAATPFAGGYLCLASPVHRTPAASTGGSPPSSDCSGSLSLDLNAFAAGLAGGDPAPELSQAGQTVTAQVWSRDTGFAPPNDVSLTNGIEYVVGP